MNEIQILSSIRDLNIVNFKEVFIEESSSTLNIVMEFCDAGDLFEKITQHKNTGYYIKEKEIWLIFIQIVKGLKILHEKHILHRDLKSANIFLNKNGTCKIGDMNVSKFAKSGFLKTQTGTPYYASPELWKDVGYNHKSDIWSLGCVLYEMTTLEPPFQAEDMEGLSRKVIRGTIRKIPNHFSKDLDRMIKSLLQVTPTLRPNCTKILLSPAVLSHLEPIHLVFKDEEYSEKRRKTIIFDKNLENLQKILPKADYSEIKTKIVLKDEFAMEVIGANNINTGFLPKIPIKKERSIPKNHKINFYLPKLKNPHKSRSLSYNKNENIGEILETYGIIKPIDRLEESSLASLQRNLLDFIKPSISPQKNTVPPKISNNQSNLKLKRENKLKKLKKLEKAYKINIAKLIEDEEGLTISLKRSINNKN